MRELYRMRPADVSAIDLIPLHFNFGASVRAESFVCKIYSYLAYVRHEADAFHAHNPHRYQPRCTHHRPLRSVCNTEEMAADVECPAVFQRRNQRMLSREARSVASA